MLDDATGAPIRVELRSDAGPAVPLEGLRIRVNPDWQSVRKSR
jgi:hypothetical protein